jgi:hypothetical protein
MSPLTGCDAWLIFAAWALATDRPRWVYAALALALFRWMAN